MRRFFPYILGLCSLLSADEVSETTAPLPNPVVIEETITTQAQTQSRPEETTPSGSQHKKTHEEEAHPQDTKEIQEQNKTFQNAIFKTFGSLVALISLVLFTIWLLKRISQNRHTFGLKSQSMQILEKRQLSPKTTLFLMEVDGKKVVFAESMLEVKVLYSESHPPTPTTPVPYNS
ncbi:MAG: flagellar biosynthetic protein FliO [Chlamydiia bacterium]